MHELILYTHKFVEKLFILCMFMQIYIVTQRCTLNLVINLIEKIIKKNYNVTMKTQAFEM